MKKDIYLLFFFILIISHLHAQQLPLFTQYREYQGMINPASVNSDFFNYGYNLSAGISYRNQWVGIPGSPSTQVVRGEYLLNSDNAYGFLGGGYLINDQAGPISMTGFYLRAAGVALVPDDDPYNGGLNIGITGGLVQYRLNSDEFKPRDPGDLNTMLDQFKLHPDVGVGLFYYYRMDGRRAFRGDVLYIGLSVPQILGLNVEFGEGDEVLAVDRIQHYYGTVGYYKRTSENSFVELSSWIKYTSGAPINVDFNLRYQISTNFWFGGGFSTAKAFNAEAGFLIGENIGWENSLIKIGYGYTYSWTTFGPFFGPTHEINLAYMLDTHGMRKFSGY